MECTVRLRLLDERCWRGIEIDAPNLRLAGQEGNTRRLIGTPRTIDQLKLSHLKWPVTPSGTDC